MKQLRRNRYLRQTLALLYGVAMLLLPLAHAPLRADARAAEIDFAEFVLPDGSLPAICFGAGGGNGTLPLTGGSGCLLACMIFAAPGLNSVLAPALAQPNCAGASVPISGSVAQALPNWPNLKQPRAPPRSEIA